MDKKVTLLIVDDEAEIRSGLRNLIDWQKYGIEHIGSARNGADALEMVRYFEPDIVITDIHMPVMNGLELIKHAKAEQFECLFVVLSGYDDFHYAQTAIKYGVTDYILKPIAVDELENLLQQLTESVISKRNQHQNQVTLSKNLTAANKTLMQQNFISELLREELTPMQINDILVKNYIPIRNEQSAAVVLYLYEQERAFITDDDESGHGSVFISLGFLADYYKAKPVICGHLDRSSIVLFHNTDSTDSLYEDTALMLTTLKSSHGIQAFGAIGMLVDSLTQINESLRLANQISSYHIFPELGSVANATVLSPIGTQNLIKDNQLLADIKAYDIDAIKQDFDAYTNSLFFTPFPPPAYLFSMYNFLIMDIRSHLAESGLQSYTDDAYQAIRQFDTFEEIKHWVLSILIEYTNELSVLQARAQDPLIKKAVEFITDNIFNKIGAEDVCRYIGYSKSYFSKYFRQKTNLNFRDYLLDVKITYAQQQLKTNAHTPKELSSMLGYEEYSSFSRAFKTRTGFSPSDYQKSFY